MRAPRNLCFRIVPVHYVRRRLAHRNCSGTASLFQKGLPSHLSLPPRFTSYSPSYDRLDFCRIDVPILILHQINLRSPHCNGKSLSMTPKAIVDCRCLYIDMCVCVSISRRNPYSARSLKRWFDTEPTERSMFILQILSLPTAPRLSKDGRPVVRSRTCGQGSVAKLHTGRGSEEKNVSPASRVQNTVPPDRDAISLSYVKYYVG